MKMVLDDLERYFHRKEPKTIRVEVDKSSSLREIFKERLLKDRVVPRDMIGRNAKKVGEEEINKFKEDFILWVKNSQHDRGLIIINE